MGGQVPSTAHSSLTQRFACPKLPAIYLDKPSIRLQAFKSCKLQLPYGLVRPIELIELGDAICAHVDAMVVSM